MKAKRWLCLFVAMVCIVTLLGGCESSQEAIARALSSGETSETASSQTVSSGEREDAWSSQADSSQAGQTPEEQSSSPEIEDSAGSPASSSSKGTASRPASGGGGHSEATSPSDSHAQESSRPSTGETSPAASQPSGGENAGGGSSEDSNTITITIAVECQEAVNQGNAIALAVSQNGYILAPTSMQLERQDGKAPTVYDALTQIAKQTGLVIGSREDMFGQYVFSIQSLAEKACGDDSGWKYEVSGVYPGFSCSKKELQDGDTVVWHYSLTV